MDWHDFKVVAIYAVIVFVFLLLIGQIAMAFIALIGYLLYGWLVCAKPFERLKKRSKLFSNAVDKKMEKNEFRPISNRKDKLHNNKIFALFKNFLRKNWGKLVLLSLTLITVISYTTGQKLSEDYHQRKKHQTSVYATVTDIEEKTRKETTTYDVGEDTKTITETITFYRITIVYQYHNKEYTYSFDTDYLTETVLDENGTSTEITYKAGLKFPIEIDAEDPAYVFAGDPGEDYRGGSYFSGGLLIVILFFWVLAKFFPNHLFTVPWFLAGLAFLVSGIYIILTNQGNFMGYILTFAITPIYFLVYVIFHKLSKDA